MRDKKKRNQKMKKTKKVMEKRMTMKMMMKADFTLLVNYLCILLIKEIYF
jgi:hypothetical protein